MLIGEYMLTRNRKILLLGAVVLLTVASALPEFAQDFRADELHHTSPGSAVRDSWEAVTLGRVEPRSGEIKIAAPVPGRIAEVPVKANESVFAGELLVRLDDQEAAARVAEAEAQVALHKRARNDQSASGAAADRRKADDAVADAERSVADAQSGLDKVTEAGAAGASKADIDAARAAFSRAQSRLRDQQDALAKLKAAPDAPLPTRLEGELNVAQAELTLGRAALEKTRIRAPADGVVLQVDAKKGEMAAPALEPAMLIMGDVSALRVRAEVDQQYLGKIRSGQHAEIRAAAFRGREFDGKVSSVARIVSPSQINTGDPRKFNDADVFDVVVDLTDPGPLVAGQQVDVYFKSEPPETE
ncbi:MAG TPA: efflux RND transporter periplasmic adaptor subunit [Xanthobacteraceae bacterium]|jgi:HlyD family secretion protein